MNEIFANNIFFLYIFTVISIVGYNQFETNKRMFLLFLTTYGLSYFKLVTICQSIFLFIVGTFIFIEILTADQTKIEWLSNIRNRILEYLIQLIFVYKAIPFIISLLLLDKKISEFFIFNNLSLFRTVSLIIFSLSINQMLNQRFLIRQFKEIENIYFKEPINSIDTNKYPDIFFDIITRLEDKSYFDRKKSFTWLSGEFFRYKLNTKNVVSARNLNFEKIKKYFKNTNHLRGYSTLEMQLIRNVGLVNWSAYGKSKIYVLERKIFELVYPYLFFGGLKKFYKKYHYSNVGSFKKYLLHVYFKTVNTRISNKQFNKFSDAFEGEVYEWSSEQFFVAVIGLTHRKFNSIDLIKKFSREIKQFDLNQQKVVEIVKEIENKEIPDSIKI